MEHREHIEGLKPVLEATDLKKNFYSPHPFPILKGINLTLRQQDTAAIMGRSGEGKSTLLHILGTIEKPCHGALSIANQPVTPFNKSMLRCQHIGFIFQSFHLLEDYTTLENVMMPARILRKSVAKGSEAYNRAYYLLEKVGLADRANFHTKLLSGGEKQRVAIARALCNDPDIILADEPSGNLDRQNATAIHELLLSFAQEHKKALLVVTHDRELAKLCQLNFQLHDGILLS